MNIGFDLDKVFIDYPPFMPDSLIEKLYKKESNGKLLYRIPGKKEQLIRYISHHAFLRPPIKDNLSFLEKFSETKNNLFLISSRFGFLEKRTNDLIKKHKFDRLFKGLYFNYANNQPHIFKDTIIKKLNIDVYTDDDFALIKYLATHNPKVRFYWLNPKSNNKILENLTGITKLSNLTDLLSKPV